jgi:hypothetical protein
MNVWQFLLHLLEHDSYTDLLQWENKAEGTFRILETVKLAALWRFYQKKSGKKISWAHMSRAMR